MAGQDVTRKVTVRGEAIGLDELKAKLSAVGAAQDSVAVASASQERATLSLEKKINSLEKSLDAEYRAQKQLETALKTINQAREQGAISQIRANELSTLAAAKFRIEGESATKAAEGMRLLKEVSIGFVSGLGVGLLTTGIAELPNVIAETVDKLGNIANVAQTIGVTTKALQELHYAARLSDVEVGTLDDAMQKFSTNLAKDGSPVEKIFKANDKKITGDVFKDLQTYADLIKNATNQEQRNVLTAAAFGKSAQEMGRLFDEGSVGLSKWADEAERAGGVISDDKIQKARALNDQMTALKPQLEAVQANFAVLVMPAEIALLQSMNDKLRETQSILEMIQKGDLVHAAGAAVIDAIGPGNIVAGAKAASKFLYGTQSNSSGSPDDRSSTSAPLDITVHGGKPGGTILPSAPDASAANALKAYDRLIEASKKRTLALNQERDALSDSSLAAQASRIEEDLLNQAKALGIKMSPARVAALHAEAEAQAAAKEALEGAQMNSADASPIDTMGKQVDKLNGMLAHGAISWQTYAKEVGKAAEVLAKDYAASADDVIGNLESITNAVAGQGKQAFEIHKALSIARAVVSGGEAIVHSYNAGSALPGGPVTGAIFAGIAAAATAAQIASIASTSYSSKSATNSISGSTATASAVAATPQASQTINFVVRGSGMISTDDIVDQMSKTIADGGHQNFIRVIKGA